MQTSAPRSGGIAHSNTPARLDYLDPIRVLLTMLVIAHHTSITYGGGGDWYYKDGGAPELTRILLSVFTGTNQSYFMGYFFLLAGYFTPASLRKKGESAFLGERMWRLCFPIFIFGYFLNPLTRALGMGAEGGDFFASFGMLVAHNDFGMGPLWFNQALIFFAAIWAFAPRFSLPSDWSIERLPLHGSIAVAIIACGALAVCLRLVVPVGSNMLGMQIGYFASYTILFFGGCALAKISALERIEFRHALPWLILSLVALPAFWLYAAFSGAFGGGDAWRGGLSLPAVLYAFWEPIMAAGVIMSSLALFRRFYSGKSSIWKRLSAGTFVAYVVHAPVAVACAWALKGLADSHLLRFVFASALSCVLSLLLGTIITEFLDKWKSARKWGCAA